MITDTLTITVTQPVGAFLLPVNYDHVAQFLGVVFALGMVMFLETLVSDKDSRLSVYLKFGLWCVVGSVFYVTSNYGLGYSWFLFYVVVTFLVELARGFHSIVKS